MDDGGRCPNCGKQGTVGSPCDEVACARRGYHRIPAVEVPADVRGLDPAIGTLVDSHLLVRVLGAGGFGAVYLALQAPLWNPTALKRLHKDPDPSNHARRVALLEGEARSLAALSHPNIVRLIKFGVSEGVPYLVMEYVEGAQTLSAEIRRRAGAGEPMTVAESRHVLNQVLDALGAAHSRHIVHRDLKPDNVMVQAVHGNPLMVRLVDFGLAKVVALTSQTQFLAGTPMYMAPEQLYQRHIGPWTDLYAVGVMSYELLSGRQPFTAPSTEALMMLKVDPDYDPLEPIASIGLPAATTAFLGQALELHPEDRFRDVETFRGAMNAAFDAVVASGDERLKSVSLTRLGDGDTRASARAARASRAARPRTSAGRSATKLVVGLGVVGMAGALVWALMWSSGEKAHDVTADTALALTARADRVGRAVDLFRVKHSRLPTRLDELTEEGLLSQERLLDPWERPFVYLVTDDTYRICSMGFDGAQGTVDDVCFRLRGASLVPEL